VWFNPLGRYHRRTEMELYYEVYGTPPGATLRTEVQVRKRGGGGFLGLFGSGKPAIRLTFQDQSDGPATRFHRTVSLERLSAGHYTLEVQVTDAGGEVRRNREDFEVKD
jgi:hypothetical protein